MTDMKKLNQLLWRLLRNMVWVKFLSAVLNLHVEGYYIIPFSKLTQEQLNNISFCEGEAIILFCLNQNTYIFYNGIDINIPRQRFSIFHEIGHHILGRKWESELVKSKVDFFSRYTIVPIPLVRRLECFM